MSHTSINNGARSEFRRHPRLRIAVPFPCGFTRTGLARWGAQDKTGNGVVLDLSAKGARVMSPVAMTAGDTLAVSLRIPQQRGATAVDATVRWYHDDAFGLEFVSLSQAAGARLDKFLTQAGIS